MEHRWRKWEGSAAPSTSALAATPTSTPAPAQGGTAGSNSQPSINGPTGTIGIVITLPGSPATSGTGINGQNLVGANGDLPGNLICPSIPGGEVDNINLLMNADTSARLESVEPKPWFDLFAKLLLHSDWFRSYESDSCSNGSSQATILPVIDAEVNVTDAESVVFDAAATVDSDPVNVGLESEANLQVVVDAVDSTGIEVTVHHDDATETASDDSVSDLA